MSKAEIVLVTGGRGYRDQDKVWDTLDDINPEVVIHGAASGVDTLAGDWAKARGRDFVAYPADWKEYGKAAGPIRNEEMAVALERHRMDGATVLVLVFPGGVGTANMRGHAVRLGLPILDVYGES